MHYLFIAQLIIMIIGPAVRLVLRMLGVGFVTYVGYNAVLDVDKMGNKKPMKKQQKAKIDGCITGTMAIGLSIEQVRSSME